jgi:hypothetical protein
MAIGKGTPGPGRPKDVPNKVTQATREAFQLLVDQNFDQLQAWINATAQDSPKDAFYMVMDLAAHCVPKLKAIEVTGSLTVPQVVVNLTAPDGDPKPQAE